MRAFPVPEKNRVARHAGTAKAGGDGGDCRVTPRGTGRHRRSEDGGDRERAFDIPKKPKEKDGSDAIARCPTPDRRPDRRPGRRGSVSVRCASLPMTDGQNGEPPHV